MQESQPEITFARELAWRVARLEEKGFSRSYIATTAKLSRGAINQILDKPQSRPTFDTVMGLVHAINSLGVQWNPDDALVAAGMKSEPVQRLFFNAEAMGLAVLPVPIFNADDAFRSGINFGSRVGEARITGSHILLQFHDKDDFLLVETIGDAEDHDMMVVKGAHTFIVVTASVARSKNYPILGKVIGRFHLGAVQFAEDFAVADAVAS